MSYENITSKHLENLKTKIQDTMSSKNLDASGQASASLEVKKNQLLGNDYIYYLDHGRGPGKFPPTLINWVRNKLGLEMVEAKQVDFLIRRKISRDGTEIFRHPNKGIQLDFLVKDMLENLNNDIANEAKAEVLKWV